MSTSPTEASGDEASLRKEFEGLSNAEGLAKLVRLIIIILVWLLFAGSILSALLGFSGSVTEPIAARILFYVLTAIFAIPAILSLIELTRRSDSASLPIIDWLAKKIACVVVRRRQKKFITRHGRQEIANRVWPGEANKHKAEKFSVTYQARIRRRWWKYSSAGIVLVAIAGVVEFSLRGGSGSPLQASVDKQFSIDNTFAITILDAPVCSDNTCSIYIRLRNISGYTVAGISTNSFIDPESAGGTALCNPFPPADCVSDQSLDTFYYVISLMGTNGHHYDLSPKTTFEVSQFGPDQTVQAKFTFRVPHQTRIEELDLSGVSKEAVVIFTNS